MKKLSLCILLSCVSLTGLIAQSISCQIVDADNKKPISYANVGILNKGVGTVSDHKGYFTLNLSESKNSDTIRISYIGYKTLDLSSADLMKYCHSGSIKLIASSYELAEIEVLPKDYKTRRVGNFYENKGISAGFQNNLLGHELGTRMKIRNKPAFIQSIQINISRCDYDSIFYRLNIYEMDGKNPGANLLREPIYLAYSKEEALAGLTIDVSKQYIQVEDDFLVTVELVKDLGELGLMFKAGLFGDKGYFRTTSHDKWQKIPVAIGVSIGAIILQEQ